MKRKQNQKGFTLAELLVVAAIIGILVAICIPIYSKQLKRARVAVNQANARAGESAAYAAYLEDPSYKIIAYDMRSGKVAKSKAESNEQVRKDLNITAYNAESNIVPVDISMWNMNTRLSANTSYKLGDYYFYRYIYTFDDTGAVKQIQANDNYKKKATDPY